MMLRIDSEQLHAALRDKRDHIGYGPIAANVSNLVAGIFYIPAAVTASCMLGRALYGVAAIAFVIFGLYNSICSIKNKYTDEDLFKDVVAMNRPLRKSLIIAVTDGADSNRYLLYFDRNWGCDFFPNRQATGNADADMESAKRYLSAEFGIPESSVTLKPAGFTESTKFSTEHQECRDYVYQLYRAYLDGIPESWTGERFTVRDKECRWMTLNEMLAGDTINSINHDVITLVRQSA